MVGSRLIQICGRLSFWQYILKLVSSYSYICNFYDPYIDHWVLAHLTLGVGSKSSSLRFHEFELIAEGQKHMKMMFS